MSANVAPLHAKQHSREAQAELRKNGPPSPMRRGQCRATTTATNAGQPNSPREADDQRELNRLASVSSLGTLTVHDQQFHRAGNVRFRGHSRHVATLVLARPGRE